MATKLDFSSLSVLSNVASRCGSDISKVLAQLDFTISADTAPISDLELGDIAKLLAAFEQNPKNVHFPFVFADSFNFEGLPAIPAFLVSANHLRDAGSLLDWIPALIHPAIRFDGLDDGNEATIEIYVDDPLGEHRDMPAFVELIASVVARLINLIAPNVSALSAVHFAHYAQTDSATYQQHFNCPVQFGTGVTQLIVSSALLDTQLPGSFPPAHAQAEESIRLKLAGDGIAPPLALQIKDLLALNFELFSEGVDAVAAKLKMHPRTLQRHLRKEGYSYSQVLAKTRHQVACEMLREGSLDIESIGFKLGFTERRSFTQAFQKWQGQTPSSYRKKAATKNPDR
jgi:AraC-like DNA-binding protein